MMKNFRLTIAYDGSRYNGWQRQSSTGNTVQGKLETVLSGIFGHKIEIHGSGRTDAGTHALAQVASFKADTELTPEELMKELNLYLPQDIAVTDVRQEDERFHARLNAKGKVYLYRIRTEAYPDVFQRRYVYELGKKLDTARMERAAELMCVTADFIGYSSLKKTKKSTVRTVYSIDIEDTGTEVRLTFRGDGFLYNMVRIMAGTLVEVGLGKRTAESVTAPLESLDRSYAGETLPAKGLTLVDVEY